VGTGDGGLMYLLACSLAGWLVGAVFAGDVVAVDKVAAVILAVLVVGNRPRKRAEP
jgi:hypothetical protein